MNGAEHHYVDRNKPGPERSTTCFSSICGTSEPVSDGGRGIAIAADWKRLRET